MSASKFRILALILVLAGILLLLLNIFKPKPLEIPTKPPTPEAGESANIKGQENGGIKVTRIIDGDTIEITRQTTKRIRYIGMDTPEKDECFYTQSKEANKELVDKKEVGLEKDVQEIDKYGRTLAYVFVDGKMVNEELVRQGFARVATFPPNVKYVDKFLAAQKTAQENNLGLWSKDACTNVLSAQSGCLIKGNINSKGEKIYHIPGQKYYEKTKIEETKGERLFCTEKEAENNGWRKSKI